MKYTSEIIHEIIETEGHIAPSTFHYESECKEEWIEYIRGAYPKLTDYEGEWINYYLEDVGIGKFPYLAFTNITQATAENCVPIRFKSAILKGQTLVNLVNNATYRALDSDITPDTNGYFINTSGTIKNIMPMGITKPNTTYTFILFLDEIYEGGLDEPQKFANSLNKDTYLKIGVNKKLHKTSASVDGNYTLHNTQINGDFKARLVILEGDYANIDIPYFEGMKSVQMPVLTTSNEDGTKTNILSTSDDVELRGIGDVKDELDCLTGEVTERIGEYQITGEENWDFLPSHRMLQISRPKFIPNIKCGAFACDKLEARQGNHDSLHGANGTYYTGYTSDNWLRIILDENLTSLEQGKEWLKANKPIIQYQLKTESVKTVGLSVINQDGEQTSLKAFEGTTHIQTNGQPIKPLLDIEVPVEAITQNLESFIEEE